MTIAIDVRRLRSEDAPACDAVIASLPYHFGLDSGRQECAEAVRRQDGLAAVSRRRRRRLPHLAAVVPVQPGDHVDGRPRRAARRRHRAGAGRAPGRRECRACALRRRHDPLGGVAGARVDDGCARTRLFYERNGFEPVWEPAGWWDAENQAVLMMRRLA